MPALNSGEQTEGGLLNRVWYGLVVLLALAVAAIPPLAAGATSGDDGPSQGRAKVDSTAAVVQLKGDPLATSEKARPQKGKKLDLEAGAARSYRAQLSGLRNDFKQWLRQNAPNAKVTGEFDVALNAVTVELNGTSLDTLRAAPQVASAEHQGLYYPLGHDDPDLGLIDAFEAWQAGGGVLSDAGTGIKIAIIDTGIDVSHPCFADEGDAEETYPESNNPRPDNEVNGGTNDKVLHAEVFNNKAANRGYGTADLNGHGTHVAGTAACNHHTPAWYESGTQIVDIPYDPSGVAPRALLGNFNVFPGPVENARSEDILNALQRAFELGYDVANMSLGGNSNGRQDLLTHAVDNLDRAGMVVAVAAGNEGPGDETVSSPGSAGRAIAAGASTVGHFVGAPVTVDGVSYGAAAGDFRTVTSTLTGTLVVAAGPVNGLDTLCTPASPALRAELAAPGTQILLITRGVCTFSTKIRNAQEAGAEAVLVVNNVAGDPTAMASDGTPNQPTIPAYMLGKTDGLSLIDDDGDTITIGATLAYFRTANDNIMAGFSSEGPTDVDFRIKPDVVAPGVNVLSAQPALNCADTDTTDAPSCWAFFSGTSMATPHVAGAAAVVMQQHPTWTAADVRSALVNTAVRGVLKDATTGLTVVDNPNDVGSGLLNLLNAVRASVSLDPVSISFGGVPSGSGQTRRGEIVVKNLTATTQTFSFSIQSTAGVTYSVSPSSVTLAPGATATVRVQVESPRGASGPDQWAWLIVRTGTTEVAHAAIYTRIK